VDTPEAALGMVQRLFCYPSSSTTRGQRFIDRRFIVVAYNAACRSASMRLLDMVATHIFASLGKGKTSSDVRQTIMRPAGKCTDVRRANGHDKVKVVTTEEDWNMVCALYTFDRETGRNMQNDPDYDFTKRKDYTIAVQPVLESRRKHVQPGVRLACDWGIESTPEERALVESVRAQERNERLNFRRVHTVQEPMIFDDNDDEDDDEEAGESSCSSEDDVDTKDDEPFVVKDNAELEYYDNDDNDATTTFDDIVVHTLRALRDAGQPMSLAELLQVLPRKVADDVQARHRRPYTMMRRNGWIAYDNDARVWSITREGIERLQQ